MELHTDSILMSGTWRIGEYNEKDIIELDYWGANEFQQGDSTIIIQKRFLLGLYINEIDKDNSSLEGIGRGHYFYPNTELSSSTEIELMWILHK
jgi:hypothetical protein